MDFGNVIFKKEEHAAVITINHPPVNAWDLKTSEDFERVIEHVENDKDLRAIVLTGGGDKCFSAGFDVSDAGNRDIISPKVRALWKRIDRLTIPVIAAINGFALGGGFELALCCHFRIMADAPKVMMGLTELNLGIIPGWGGTQRLPLVVGKAKALDMILFSKKVGAEEALEMGLVNRISPPERLMDDALAFAGRLARRPPVAVKSVLKAISALYYEGLDRGLEVEEEGTAAVRESKDSVEGFTAFMEKREPVFVGE